MSYFSEELLRVFSYKLEKYEHKAYFSFNPLNTKTN